MAMKAKWKYHNYCIYLDRLKKIYLVFEKLGIKVSNFFLSKKIVIFIETNLF